MEMRPRNFCFRRNPGEPLRPLRAIASSGEISRVMLAFKSALADKTMCRYLFSMRLTPISAERSPRKSECKNARTWPFASSALHHSSPQVAAAASQSIYRHQGRSKTTAPDQPDRGNGKSREEEIARMLGGKSESALAHARALLEQRQNKFPRFNDPWQRRGVWVRRLHSCPRLAH